MIACRLIGIGFWVSTRRQAASTSGDGAWRKMDESSSTKVPFSLQVDSGMSRRSRIGASVSYQFSSLEPVGNGGKLCFLEKRKTVTYTAQTSVSKRSFSRGKGPSVSMLLRNSWTRRRIDKRIWRWSTSNIWGRLEICAARTQSPVLIHPTIEAPRSMSLWADELHLDRRSLECRVLCTMADGKCSISNLKTSSCTTLPLGAHWGNVQDGEQQSTRKIKVGAC